MAVPAHDEIAGCPLRVEGLEIVQQHECDAAEIALHALRNGRERGVAIIVAAHGDDRRDHGELIDDVHVADVTGMQDVIAALKRGEGFGTQQAVSVGNDADAQRTRVHGASVAAAAGRLQNACMQLHTDFAARVVIRPGDVDWAPSPEPGVDRMRLERDGDEIARATSIVRYAPGSAFAMHVHGGGEEILVLDGVFSDEHGDYPAGSYLRNPIGSRHTPYSKPGCTLLVKLWQFQRDDSATLRLQTQGAAFEAGSAPGITRLPLHQHGSEVVSLLRFAPGARANAHAHAGGEELYVLEGELRDEHGDYPAGTWIRSPAGSQHHPWSPTGCLLYSKTGHLPPR